MSEIEKSKRKFWQFQLSTAILLMLMSAAILWANTRRYGGEIIFAEGHFANFGSMSADTPDTGIFGWPFAMGYQHHLIEYSGPITDEGFRRLYDASPIERQWKPSAIILNFGVSTVLLAITVILSEWSIRRREDRGH